MRRRITILLAVMAVCLTAAAQRVATVEAEYVYHVPSHLSDEDARRIGLDLAKKAAIADEFGTLVTQNTTVITENSANKSSTSFYSIGDNEVRGEWLETIGEPVFKPSYEGEERVLRIYVKGQAREIVNSSVDFEAVAMRNGNEEKGDIVDFNEGDLLQLAFQTPVDGYVSVYLFDEAAGTFFALLPNQYDTKNGAFPVEGNKKYVFFPASHDEEGSLMLYCASHQLETNALYVLFSTKDYKRPRLSQSSAPMGDGYETPNAYTVKAFKKWFVNARNKDKDFTYKTVTIKIRKRG